MGPIEYIRKTILGVSQAVLAEIAGVTQATVSRWESGESEPTRAELDRIRIEAVKRGVLWEDRWFFERPDRVEAAE